MNQLIRMHKQYKDTVLNYEVDLRFILQGRLSKNKEDDIEVWTISAETQRIGVQYLDYFFLFQFDLDPNMNVFTVRGRGKTKPYDSKENKIERKKAYEHCISAIIKALNEED